MKLIRPLVLPPPQVPIRVYGDESTAGNIITYGLVALDSEEHERDALVAWQRVLLAAGGASDTRVHAKDLFSGQGRPKTAWAHLSEKQAAQLVLDLMTSLKQTGARFFLGICWQASYDQGLPSGLTPTGAQKYAPATNEFCYGMAAMAAVQGMRTMPGGVLGLFTPYRLFAGRQETLYSLFDDWPRQRVSTALAAAGLQLTPFKKDPLLLDAADLFAYCSGRARASAPARNKQVCEDVYAVCSPTVTEMRWDDGA